MEPQGPCLIPSHCLCPQHQGWRRWWRGWWGGGGGARSEGRQGCQGAMPPIFPRPLLLHLFYLGWLCYFDAVYARATESYKARMAAFSAQSTSTVKCCSLQGQCTQCTGKAYGDSWQQCGWQTGYSVSCYQYLDACETIPTGSNTEDITAPLESLLCYRQHKSYVEAQTVAYWLTWLAPIPSWLQSIVMMQQVNVTRAQTTLQTGFDCTAFR